MGFSFICNSNFQDVLTVIIFSYKTGYQILLIIYMQKGYFKMILLYDLSILSYLYIYLKQSFVISKNTCPNTIPTITKYNELTH